MARRTLHGSAVRAVLALVAASGAVLLGPAAQAAQAAPPTAGPAATAPADQLLPPAVPVTTFPLGVPAATEVAEAEPGTPVAAPPADDTWPAVAGGLAALAAGAAGLTVLVRRRPVAVVAVPSPVRVDPVVRHRVPGPARPAEVLPADVLSPAPAVQARRPVAVRTTDGLTAVQRAARGLPHARPVADQPVAQPVDQPTEQAPVSAPVER